MNIRFITICLWTMFACNITKAQSYFYTVGSGKTHLPLISQEQEEVTDIIQPSDTVSTMPEEINLSKYVAYPLESIRVTSPFGMRKDPFKKNTRRMHSGIDLKAHFDDVHSMLPGIVLKTGYSRTGGYYVSLAHGKCICTYLHLSQIRVQEGMHVSAGDIVATSGCSGLRCTGPHLHISCRWDGDSKGKYFNPSLLLKFVAMKLRENGTVAEYD